MTQLINVAETAEHQRLIAEVECIFSKAEPHLRRLIRMQGISAECADDVIQETMLEAWRGFERLRDPHRVAAWLDGICRNICRRHHRAQEALEREVSLTASHNAGADAIAFEDIADPDAFDPAEELNRQDMAVLLDRALGYLGGDMRATVEVCYLEDLPQKEAAARLGLTISALEARLHRARRQLRQILSGDLRADAEAFGLIFSPEEATGWRETREWCIFCGNRRMWGTFDAMPNGRVSLIMRCPDCTRGDFYFMNSLGLIDLRGRNAFRPALKQTTEAFASFYTNAMQHGSEAICWICGGAIQISVAQISRLLEQQPDLKTWIQWTCACGQNHSWSLIACANHPEITNFLLHYDHCRFESDTIVTFQNQPAVRLCLSERGGRRLSVFLHPETLTVLATIVE